MEMSLSLPKIPINYSGFFNFTGYGQAASSNVFALHKSGLFDIRIDPVNSRPSKEAYTEEQFDLLMEMRAKPLDENAFQVLHMIPQQYMRVKNLKRRIAFPTFETFNPPADWITLLNRCDCVFVPSKFNLDTFTRAGVKRPMFHIPHILNLDIWNKDIIPLRKNDKFTFLFVGTWRPRKGGQLLIDAWVREFESDENVQLIIKTDSVDKARQAYLQSKKNWGKKETATVLFEREVFKEHEMARFIKSADCLISPTLGEGFGLPPIQAMSVKVPVIVTNFSGCKDYAKSDNCTLLEPSGYMVHDCLDPSPQFKLKKWPRVKVADIQEAMRQVLQKYQGVQDKSDKAYELVQSQYGYEAFSSKFQDMMENVYGANNFKTKTLQRNA